MSDNPPSIVLDDELLARYIFSKRHFRPSDLTVKPEAFSPPSNLEFSVTRHLNLNEEDLWAFGQLAGTNRPENLYGRADLKAVQPRKLGLQVNSAPVLENNNHAVLIGWPSDKPSQMIIQLELARSAVFLRVPNPPTE